MAHPQWGTTVTPAARVRLRCRTCNRVLRLPSLLYPGAEAIIVIDPGASPTGTVVVRLCRKCQTPGPEDLAGVWLRGRALPLRLQGEVAMDELLDAALESVRRNGRIVDLRVTPSAI